MEAIRTIFFDAVGTLIQPSPPVAEVYARIGCRYGADLPPEVLWRRFREAFQRQEDWDARHGQRTSEDRERARWRAIVAEVFHDQPKPTAPFPELWDYFASPAAWACHDDVAGCVTTLHARGLTLGIASNFDGRLRNVVAGLPALRFCKLLVISAEVGWRKPAPQFFQAMIDAAGQRPAQMLLVGDDLVNDYQGAHQAGLAAALLDRRRNGAPAASLQSLTELDHLLEALV